MSSAYASARPARDAIFRPNVEHHSPDRDKRLSAIGSIEIPTAIAAAGALAPSVRRVHLLATKIVALYGYTIPFSVICYHFPLEFPCGFAVFPMRVSTRNRPPCVARGRPGQFISCCNSRTNHELRQGDASFVRTLPPAIRRDRPLIAARSHARKGLRIVSPSILRPCWRSAE
jgi:hypothetical protein